MKDFIMHPKSQAFLQFIFVTKEPQKVIFLFV